MTPRLGMMLIALVALVASAHAQDKAAARQAYLEGSKYYDLNQYAEALEAFKRAYWSYEDPVIIYNIAQCHRALGHKKEAVDSYRSYLRKSPDARNRPDVEKIIVELTSAIDKERAIATAKPDGTMASDAAPPPKKSADPPPVAAAPTPAAVVSMAPPAKTEAPKKRTWIWGVAAGAVVLVGVVVGVGVGIGAQPSAPTATDGTVRF